MSMVATRDGENEVQPQGAIFGPKVMLINEMAGSGGDAMPWYFRKAGLGPLIGKRTWGGLVGRAAGVPLMDGGYRGRALVGGVGSGHEPVDRRERGRRARHRGGAGSGARAAGQGPAARQGDRGGDGGAGEEAEPTPKRPAYPTTSGRGERLEVVAFDIRREAAARETPLPGAARWGYSGGHPSRSRSPGRPDAPLVARASARALPTTTGLAASGRKSASRSPGRTRRTLDRPREPGPVRRQARPRPRPDRRCCAEQGRCIAIGTRVPRRSASGRRRCRSSSRWRSG